MLITDYVNDDLCIYKILSYHESALIQLITAVNNHDVRIFDILRKEYYNRSRVLMHHVTYYDILKVLVDIDFRNELIYHSLLYKPTTVCNLKYKHRFWDCIVTDHALIPN